MSVAKLTQTLPPPASLQMSGVVLGQAVVWLLVFSSCFSTSGESEEGLTAKLEPCTTPVATTAVDTGLSGLCSLAMDSDKTTAVTWWIYVAMCVCMGGVGVRWGGGGDGGGGGECGEWEGEVELKP